MAANAAEGMLGNFSKESIPREEIQRESIALDLVDCKVDQGGFDPNPLSPAALFDFSTGSLAKWASRLVRE
ncbi:MAG: hypothetical protein FJ083_14640 [Cyanobacteria bacterium K_Offshore_surface_m2_239]|nr:hypothetical protein [Cyanobacteria bacterium K_Offshore_surface_m2_239]